jgi:hypothetical protein
MVDGDADTIRIAPFVAPVKLTVDPHREHHMSTFVVRPITGDVTASVRATLRAPGYGHPVHRELARGTGPCRECLSTFDVGVDERLLFTHDPFAGAAQLSQPGPVFVHANACEPFAEVGYPLGLAALPVVAESWLRDGSRSKPHALVRGRESEALEEIMTDSAVDFIHLRHAEAGCFIARVDRRAE